jgi:hypothetical protein
MKVPLPKPIARYFAADQANANAVAECFSENAVVVDENQRYTGREAIRRWKELATARPGSPVNLRYTFELDGDRIAALEITV